MVLVSPNFPSAVGHQGGLPHPGPKPSPDAVLVQLTCAVKMDAPFAITGDAFQWLWLSPEAAEYVVASKNGTIYQPK